MPVARRKVHSKFRSKTRVRRDKQTGSREIQSNYQKQSGLRLQAASNTFECAATSKCSSAQYFKNASRPSNVSNDRFRNTLNTCCHESDANTIMNITKNSVQRTQHRRLPFLLSKRIQHKCFRQSGQPESTFKQHALNKVHVLPSVKHQEG